MFHVPRKSSFWVLPSFLSFAVSGFLSAGTVVTTFSPIRVDQSAAVALNLNASLGPSLDTSNDLEFLVEDLGGSSFLSVLGLSGAQVAISEGDVADLAFLFNEGDSVGPGSLFPAEETGLETELATDIIFGGIPLLSQGEWGGGGSGYLGLSFQINEETHYGFVRVTWNPDNDGTDNSSFAVIDKIGYNTVAGEPAIIPEPSSAILGLFALVPFALVRRR